MIAPIISRIHRGLSFATKYHSSKMRVFLLLLKQSFQCLSEYRHGSPKHRCLIRAVRGHWEFCLAAGNAGTGMYQRGTIEHGCEFVPVARQKKKVCRNSQCPLQALCGICARRTASIFSQSNRKDSLQLRKHAL